MDTKELKSLYYGKLAIYPDSPVWEEFEYESIELADKWCRFAEPIPHNEWGSYRIRHNPKPKKWQPVHGDWFIDTYSNFVVKQIGHGKETTDFGLIRTNQEQAEQDLKQIRQFCRFLAWRAENCCYSDGIVPVLDYAGCFLNSNDYANLRMLIDSGEVEL